MVSTSNNDETPTAHAWPEACPHPSETAFLSVCVRPTQYHFAVHCGKSMSYKPALSWKVPISGIPDDHDETNLDNVASMIVNYIPKEGGYRELFLPTLQHTEFPTIAEVIDYMVNCKEAPVVSLYIISGADPLANRKLEKLFCRYPVRILHLQSTDFNPSKGLLLSGASTYDLGVLCGAPHRPALIIESGEVVTLTTIDENNHLAVVSTCMGIFSRLEFAIQNTDALGHNPDDVKDLVDYFLEQNEPLSMTDPTHAVLIGALKPLLLSVSLLLQNFLEMYGQKDSIEDANIIIHGPHGNVLHLLLQQKHLSKLSKEMAANFIPNIKLDDGLVHKGIGNMLVQRDTPVIPGSAREKCLHFVGQRIARKFSRDGTDPDQAIMYLGVVSGFVSVKDGNAWDDHLFEVIYDDGDREDLTIGQLYEALRLYNLEGKERLLASTGEAALAKKEASETAARSLVKWSAKMQRALKLPQIAPSEHYPLTAEDESNQAPEVSTNRKRAASRPRLVSPDEQKPTEKKPRKQTPRKRKANLKNPSPKKKPLPADQCPYGFVGRRIAKEFAAGFFCGTIVSIRKSKRIMYWQVKYDDSDSEELDYAEVLNQTDLYESSHLNQGDTSTPQYPSKKVADEFEAMSDPKQPERSKVCASPAPDQSRQDTGEPVVASDHDESIQPSNGNLTYEV